MKKPSCPRRPRDPWILLDEAEEKLREARTRRNRLRFWIRRWSTTPPVALCLNEATRRLAREMEQALAGDKPSKEK